MQTYPQIFERAVQHHGSEQAVQDAIPDPVPAATLAGIEDDRWLSAMTRCVFQAGFNWKVVDAKWPGFEAAFSGFNPKYVASFSDEAIDQLMADTRVIRQRRKLEATRHNARFLTELASEHGSVSQFFLARSPTGFVDLLDDLKKRGAWLGGTTAQYFLRNMGVDAFILSRDVVKALNREGVIDGEPRSNAAMREVQGAFNNWMAEGGENLTRVSRVLALSVG